MSQAEAAESLFQTHSSTGEPIAEDRLFEQSWADALVATSLEQLSAEYQSEDKQKLFERLKIFLTGSPDPLPSYDQLSIEMGMPAASIRTYVTRLRTLPGNAARSSPSNGRERSRSGRRVARTI